MNIEIRAMDQGNDQRIHLRVHAFQCEYLDDESVDEFVNRMNANPDLYLTAWDADELVGLCYGHPSGRDESSVNLQGIAVSLDERKGYARRGIGSRLIAEFESAVKRKGFDKIGVGSADDPKVEHFYVKNGFKPCELVAKGPDHEEYERVKIQHYEHGKVTQQQLRDKHHPTEVIFIFEKVL